jgi:hypothetical protein
MPQFVRARRGILINLDHVAVLKPLARERTKAAPGHYTCLAWNGQLLGTVAASEIAALLGQVPEEPDEEPNYELFVIGGRS